MSYWNEIDGPVDSKDNLGPLMITRQQGAGDAGAWRAQAACAAANVPTSVFFPDVGRKPGPRDDTIYADARAVCERCTVVAECLADALAWAGASDFGYRALTTPADRRRIAAGRQQKSCEECGTMFAPTSNRALCCSPRCSKARHKRQTLRARARAQREAL